MNDGKFGENERDIYIYNGEEREQKEYNMEREGRSQRKNMERRRKEGEQTERQTNTQTERRDRQTGKIKKAGIR